MRTMRLGPGLMLALAAALVPSAPHRAAAQGANAAPLIFQSIDGTVDTVDPKLNGIILRDAAGKRHAWKLGAPVIAEAARAKVGDRMWVIYRPQGKSQRAVTALGFPGTEEKPLYVNATGDPVVLRTGPATDGVCRTVPSEQMTGHVLRAGATVIDDAPCWCCANRGEECQLANRSHDDHGTGRIVLARCFP